MLEEGKYRIYAERVKIFKGLEPDDVKHILQQGKILHYHEGQTIFHEGMSGSNLFVVLNGEIGIYRKTKLIAKCSIGDAFGEMSVLNQRPRSATAAALTTVSLFALDERQINQILHKHVAVRVLLNVIHVLSEHLKQPIHCWRERANNPIRRPACPRAWLYPCQPWPAPRRQGPEKKPQSKTIAPTPAQEVPPRHRPR